MVTRTVTGDQNWVQYKTDEADVFDILECTNAIFRTAGWPNTTQQRYPLLVDKHVGAVTVQNGTVLGEWSLTEEWGRMYTPPDPFKGNGAAVFVRDGPAAGATVKGWRLKQVWDGIRITGCPFLIENCWLTIARDDVVEVDDGFPGTIQNILGEECFTGLSFGSNSTKQGQETNVQTYTNVLIGMGLWNRSGTLTHASPLKSNYYSPQVLITNSDFAISRVDHNDFNNLTRSMSKVHSSSANNYWLNLTDNALPTNYPSLHGSFTVLNGSAARERWSNRRDAFIATWNGDPPPDPDPDPDPMPTPTIDLVVTVNPVTGALRFVTAQTYSAAVLTAGASNSFGSDEETLTASVSEP